MIHEDGTMDVMVGDTIERRKINYRRIHQVLPLNRKLPEFSISRHYPVLKRGEEVEFIIGSNTPIIIKRS